MNKVSNEIVRTNHESLGIFMRNILFTCCFALVICTTAYAQGNYDTMAPQVKIENGTIAGANASGVLIFRGIPFAEPPVGDLRWKEPRPVKNWTGVRQAVTFGSRPMQPAIFGDMVFRSPGISEDCLYLNVWTSAKSENERLPVLVYFYGGGFIAGDASEYRYDGESMARRGVVVVTVNYRLGVFGFLAHPELTKESPHHSSGNYGMLDQAAAIQWVNRNIKSFGGDPTKITIAGESAGSISVSAQMISPLSKTLIAGAIGESGSLLGTLPARTLADAEQVGIDFAKSIQANSLAEMRAVSAEIIMAAASRLQGIHFSLTIDGYFLPKSPSEIFKAGEQAHVPLLVGWNSEESSFHGVLGQEKPTVENYTKAVQKLYRGNAENILKVYHAASDEEVEQVASGFSTWKWSDIHSKTGGKPVYRYLYQRPRLGLRSDINKIEMAQSEDSKTPEPYLARGAVHSAEIEYAMGNLPTNRVYDWKPEDYKVSEIMQSFFANFIKTGNPNGSGVPEWPSATGMQPVPVMHIDVTSKTIPEAALVHERYIVLDQLSGN
jgi:para-nitrobenzyl esterase